MNLFVHNETGIPLYITVDPGKPGTGRIVVIVSSTRFVG